MYAYAVTGRYRETRPPPHTAWDAGREAGEMSNITQEYLVLFRAVTEAEQALEELRQSDDRGAAAGGGDLHLAG